MDAEVQHYIGQASSVLGGSAMVVLGGLTTIAPVERGRAAAV